MWRFLLALLIALLLLGPSSARAELGDYNLGILTRKAWGCGNALQGFRTMQIEEHYPDFRARFLKLAEGRGASDWQLEALEAVFEAGIRNAIREGIVPGDDVEEDFRESAIEEFDRTVYRCIGY